MKSAIQKARRLSKSGAANKEKRTFSLSPDVVEYLETRCAETQAQSLSAYLESLIRELQARVEMQKLEAATKEYYDGLTAGDMDEQAEWGRVGAASVVQVEE
jgi:hypothetical protein